MRQQSEEFAGLLQKSVATAEVRDDVAPAELVVLLPALTTAGALGSDAAVRRLVEVTRRDCTQPQVSGRCSAAYASRRLAIHAGSVTDR